MKFTDIFHCHDFFPLSLSTSTDLFRCLGKYFGVQVSDRSTTNNVAFWCSQECIKIGMSEKSAIVYNYSKRALQIHFHWLWFLHSTLVHVSVVKPLKLWPHSPLSSICSIQRVSMGTSRWHLKISLTKLKTDRWAHPSLKDDVCFKRQIFYCIQSPPPPILGLE